MNFFDQQNSTKEEPNQEHQQRESNIPETKDEEFERKFVLEAYEKIAEEFDQSRQRIWSETKVFLDKIIEDKSTFSKVLEVGCGNGRNLAYLAKESGRPMLLIGIDNCGEFVDITRQKSEQILTYQGDNLKLDFTNNVYNYVLSVAVIHHFSTIERRIKAISELVRVTIPGGKIFIQVWAEKDKPASARKYFTPCDKSQNATDYLIPWRKKRGSPKKTTEPSLIGILHSMKDGSDQPKTDEGVPRYYHLFKEGELEKLVNVIPGIVIQKSFSDGNNYGVILQKLKV